MQAAIEVPVLRWESATLDACMRYRALALSNPSAEHAAANLYMWDEKYPKEIAFFENLAAVRVREEQGDYHYLFPVGEGDPIPLLQALYRESAARGQKLRLVSVSESELACLVAQWGEKIEFEETRDWEDYLYDAEKLATLSGKKLHFVRLGRTFGHLTDEATYC